VIAKVKFTIASIYLAYKAVRKSGAHTHGRVESHSLSLAICTGMRVNLMEASPRETR
jgi:hypothetical protein